MLKRRMGPWVCVAAATVLAAGLAASAQEEQSSFKLSLEQCLRLALENNLDLVSAGKQPEIAEQRVRIQRANFDPLLTSSARHFELTQEITNQFSLDQLQQDSGTVGVGQNLNFGADYQVTLESQRTMQSGPLVTTPSTYESTLDLTFTLPLLQGFGRETATEQLILARNDLQINRNEFRVQVDSTLEGIEGAYWDVLAAQEGLRIANLALERAKDLLELNRKKVEVGTLAPIEITQAEAGVASEVERVIVAEVTVQNAEDELRRLMAVPQNDPMWGQRIEITDTPSFAPVDVDSEQALSTAMTQRPEMAIARQTLRSSELSERVARRAQRPTLDLQLNYAPSGNNLLIPPEPGPDGMLGTADDIFTEGQLVESISDIKNADEYQWSVAANFAYPIGNRAQKANFAVARLSRERAEVDLANQEQTIRVEVRRAVRDVESGVKRVEAARANVVLQRKKLDAEQKKFDNGMSTSFEVLTFQNDLADAELSEIRARLDYMKALAALERVKGTLLEARGLSLGI